MYQKCFIDSFLSTYTVSILPKLRKEKRDEIIQYINEGLSDIEIHEKTGRARSTIAGIRKELSPETVGDTVTEETRSPDKYLSSEAIRKIGVMTGMYGAGDPNEAIDMVFEDVKVLMKLKYKHSDDIDKSLREVFSEVSASRIDAKRVVDRVLDLSDDFRQFQILRVWGMDWAVLAFYNIAKTLFKMEVSLMGFLNKAVIESFKEYGHGVEYYWNEDFKEYLPILISPTGGRLKWPFSFEDQAENTS